MKNIFTLLVLSGLSIAANAQITAGYYHVKNATTGRCLVMTDNTKGATDTQKGSTIDFGAVETNKNVEYFSTHPGAVCYISSIGGNKYDVAAQGTSISKLAGGLIYPIIEKQSDGTYTIRGQYSSFNIMLGDMSNTDRATGEYKDEGKLTQVSTLERGTWQILPIGTSATGDFIGIKPEVQTADGTWWGSFFAGFAFKLHSTGMKAYYVDSVNDTEFTLKEITTAIIPAGTPVIIQCTSSDYKENIISPEKSSTEAISSCLGAVYFDRTDANHKNAKAYDKNIMRVLGVDENKQLVFQVAPESYLKNGAYLPHNKCYLGVSTSAADVLHVKGTTSIIEVKNTTNIETANEGTFNLKGQRVKDEPTTPGVYIRNGEKIIIK